MNERMSEYNLSDHIPVRTGKESTCRFYGPPLRTLCNVPITTTCFPSFHPIPQTSRCLKETSTSSPSPSLPAPWLRSSCTEMVFKTSHVAPKSDLTLHAADHELEKVTPMSFVHRTEHKPDYLRPSLTDSPPLHPQKLPRGRADTLPIPPGASPNVAFESRHLLAWPSRTAAPRSSPAPSCPASTAPLPSQPDLAQCSSASSSACFLLAQRDSGLRGPSDFSQGSGITQVLLNISGYSSFQ